ncbi:DMP19 family protein [Chitinophaga varians]|uniref:DMP19 family protein n=1 Tax=Chitinophaga varians TaxID=2202339 RepID=UPI00165F24DE|nr:DMP19 family protein [Chitinophaga varians]MBC9909650.1 DMP19 family protein [Chitinophaga varians]
MEFLPTVSKEVIEAAGTEDWDFIYTIIEPYENAIEEAEDEEEILDQLSDDQHALLIYNALYGQVTNGGFLQLIHNGYGQFVFDPVFVEDLQRWSMNETAALVKKAMDIYQANQVLLDQDRDLEAFSALYKTFTAFEPLDAAFYDVMDEEVKRFRNYIETNLDSFVKIEQA